VRIILSEEDKSKLMKEGELTNDWSDVGDDEMM
jgi:hypothetical protein